MFGIKINADGEVLLWRVGFTLPHYAESSHRWVPVWRWKALRV